MTDPMLDSLAAAVQASPADIELRALYADRLAQAGRSTDAIGQALVVLAQDAHHAGASSLLVQLKASGAGTPAAEPPTAEPPTAAVHTTETPDPGPFQSQGQGDTGVRPAPSQSEAQASDPAEANAEDIDWDRLEGEIGEPTKPPFVVQGVTEQGVAVTEAADESAPLEIIRETMTLDDVGGLEPVKRRIRETFLDPIANPEIAKAFMKSLGGGLLLYGPPGCGKTFMARAIAGELGASFMSVTVADILSKWLGESEHQMRRTFIEARQRRPSVLFFDEIDAVGGKRSSHGSGTQHMRTVVNQLLMEMDGIGADNDGVFVLAATNMPWDIDPALLRPGRFDRMVLVLPPDPEARDAILRMQLDDRPLEGIDLAKLVKRTDGFSGADLRHLCDTAAEKAMADSIKSGTVRPISMHDMELAFKEVKPSIGPWLDSAANVVAYGNNDGRYDELEEYLKRAKRL